MKQKNLILMVIAVGCGLVAAFLTSQMSAKGQVEQVEVVVAAKDLPVGTMLSREELQKSVKLKKMSKDALPPAYVGSTEELVDKRLSRPVRAEETFNPQDLSKGGAITLPEGYDMVSMQVGVAQAAAGFVGPGSRVNILATVRLGNKTRAFPLLVNMLVVAVDTHTVYTKEGTFPSMNTVSFAVKEKEALLLSLARTRGCSIELLLRHPSKNTEADKDYKLEDVLKLLADDKNFVTIENSRGGTEPDPSDPVKPTVVDPTTPTPRTNETVKVLIATRDIAPNTMLTKDLVTEVFVEKELPKDFAGDAYGDLTPALNLAVKTGVSKGQWVTPSMVGLQSMKVSPIDEFVPHKAGEKPPTALPPGKRPIYDVALHTTSGTVIIRYEEVEPGKWKKVAELTPEQAAKADRANAAPQGPAPKQ